MEHDLPQQTLVLLRAYNYTEVSQCAATSHSVW